MRVICNGMSEKNISFSKKTSIFLFIIVIIIFFIGSCTKSENFTIGENFLESQTGVKLLDTFTVDLSTVILDSLKTSGTGIALVGKYSDNIFGSISCKSYFELGYPTEKFNETDVFDSANFILCYSKYYYGDTTSLMTLNIHQLTKQITLDEITGYRYNIDSMELASVLGTKVFHPRPKTADTIVTVPINSFGEQIFDLIKNNNEVVSTSDQFFEYMKGFAITEETGDGNSIIGFKADGKHIFMNIYYHAPSSAPVAKTYKIIFYNNDASSSSNSSYQFNHIHYNISKTAFSNIKGTGNILPSSKTGNKAFLQGLIGLLPKIQFPTLQNLLLENRWKIIKAELVIAPVLPSYAYFTLPSKLYLWETDKDNHMNTQLVNSRSEAIVSTLYTDNLYNEDTRYIFDITSYINTEASDLFYNPYHGLLISLSSTDLISTFTRMAIEGKNPVVKLRLYYLTY
jgi:hypothetical protein